MTNVHIVSVSSDNHEWDIIGVYDTKRKALETVIIEMLEYVDREIKSAKIELDEVDRDEEYDIRDFDLANMTLSEWTSFRIACESEDDDDLVFARLRHFFDVVLSDSVPNTCQYKVTTHDVE